MAHDSAELADREAARGCVAFLAGFGIAVAELERTWSNAPAKSARGSRCGLWLGRGWPPSAKYPRRLGIAGRGSAPRILGENAEQMRVGHAIFLCDKESLATAK
jgi:hypothetical protein